MRRIYTYPIAGLALLLSLSCLACNETKPVAPTIEAVTFNHENVEQYLLTDNSLELTNAYINVFYSDETIVKVGMDVCSISELTYEFGENRANIKYSIEEENYYFSLEYYVFSQDTELNIIKNIHSLPLLNKLTMDHVELVISIVDSYTALSETEKNFLNTYFENDVTRLEKTESRLTTIYHENKLEELNDYYRTLNQSVYADTNLNSIKVLIDNFASTDFKSLKEIVNTYQTVLTNIKNMEKIVLSLEEYKERTVSYLQEKFIIKLFNVIPQNSINVFEKIEKNYLEDEDFGKAVNEVIAKINGASDTDAVDKNYTEGFISLEKTLLPSVVADFTESIFDVFNDLRDIEKELLESWDDISISVKGLFDNILVDYLDDNRWWTPEIYRPKTILDNTQYEFEKGENLDYLVKLYDELVYEITRATLQKNLEMYYSIWRNRNPAYDTTDTYYWNNIADYWGDTPAQQFVYDGPLSQYKGNIYGSSSSNCYRLAGYFYRNGLRLMTPEGLLNQYFFYRNHIAPPPLALVDSSIDLDTLKTEYNINEPIDLTGGTATVTYNDTSTAKVELDNSMIVEPVDTSTLGSKIVRVAFKDPKLNEDCEASFAIVVLSNNPKYNAILNKISHLPEITKVNETNIEKVLEILVLFDDLSDLELDAFIADFSIEYYKFREYESMCAEFYGDLLLKPLYITYEKINLFAYSVENRNKIQSAFNSLITNVASCKLFRSIENEIETFNNIIETTQFDSTLTVEQFKEATIQSVDALLEYETYQYGGQNINITITSIKKSLIEKDEILSFYNSFLNVIESCSTKDEITSKYNEYIENLYSKVIVQYKLAAYENVRQSLFDIRATISSMWAVGDNDIVEMKGEANSKFTTDYLDDGGYYCWYIPIPYQTGNMYSKIKISESADSKYLIKESYEFALFDMSRAAMYRNILHTWAFTGLSGSWWSVVFCSPALAYDGAIPEYEGTVFADSSYRLWGWGYRAGGKATSLTQLVEKYNYDLAIFYKG